MLLIVLTMIVFAAVHSFMAGADVKAALQRRFGERTVLGFYRLVFNIIAVITFAPAFYIAATQPDRVLWQLESVVGVVALSIQVIGFIGLVVSLVAIDLGQFSGISQARAYWRGDQLPLPTEPLQVRGVYALVRHPLYLFSLMVLWPVSTMTDTYFVLVVASTLYFTLGSLLEEKRLVRVFGQQYVDYQRQVPWLIPFLH